VRNGRLAPTIEDTWCFGIEAEPGHFGFLCETYLQNGLNGLVLFGAVTDHVGWEKFYSRTPPADNYGQSLRSSGNLLVPCYTVDYLVATFGIEHIDLIHADVQGEEPNVLRGALASMENGIIDYMLICPHKGTRKEEIEELVDPYYDVIISIDARAGYLDMPGFPKPVYHPQDGIVVCKRKGLP
jgi:FkbM family methyltransferase